MTECCRSDGRWVEGGAVAPVGRSGRECHRGMVAEGGVVSARTKNPPNYPAFMSVAATANLGMPKHYRARGYTFYDGDALSSVPRWFVNSPLVLTH